MATRSIANNWLIGLLVFLVGMLSYRFIIENTSLLGSSKLSRPVTARGDLAADEKNNIDVYNNASPSVVLVTTADAVRRRSGQTGFVQRGQGTGIVWDKSGYIVTNYHVVQGAIQTERGQAKVGAVMVTLDDGGVFKAQIHAFAPRFDIAVLKVEQAIPGRLTPLAIGESSDLKVGQKVYAIGNPFGFNRTLTKGIISGLGRNLGADRQSSLEDMIQTDAAINPGNSGGPLLDSAGRMIGMNTVIYSPAAAASGVGQNSGIGFAVPIDTINAVVPRLIEGGFGTKPGLGVGLVTDNQVSQLQQIGRLSDEFEGAIVFNVSLGSSADEAGLRDGDVIIGLDDKAIVGEGQLSERLRNYEIGSSVRLRIIRQGQEAEVVVKLQAILDLESFERANAE